MRVIRKLKIIIFASLAIVISVFSILLFASETQTFLLSKDLYVGEFIHQVDEYKANVTDGGDSVAHLYFRIDNSSNASAGHFVLFQIWHAEDTELDSITLRFSLEPYGVTLYLEASTYVWASGSQFSDDGLAATIFSVKDMGWCGTGTVDLNFILSPRSPAKNLVFTMDFTMHRKTFLQLTSLKAHGNFNIQIPD
jgi:hypothetical protein